MGKDRNVREQQAPFGGAAPKRLKVRKIGNSLGVVIPVEDLARHQIKEGDELHLSHTGSGLTLDVYDPDVAEQVEAGRAIARQYRNTLRELAK